MKRLFFGLSAIVLLAGCGMHGSPDPEPDLTQVEQIRKGLTAAVSKTAKAGGGEKAAGPELKRVDGWATLTGHFKVDGAVRQPATISVTKDEATCGKHSLFDESLVVDKDGNLANVVVFVRTPKIPINKSYEKDAKGSVVLDNVDCRFEPHVQHVAVGQTLRIKNSDNVAHNTSLQGKALQGNPLIPSGSTTDLSVDAAEREPVMASCSIHPWMKARVVVTSNPYCAVSAKDGTFELKDLPAGELELQFWQESSGPLAVSSPDLKPGSGPGRYIVSLDPDKPKDLKDLVVSASAFK